MDRIIELEEIRITRGAVDIIKDCSLAFPRGKTTIITGSSGCGKSTLLKVAAGIMPPDRGRVYCNGQEYRAMTERRNIEFRRESGFVFQDAALWENQTIYQNIGLPLRFHFPRMTDKEIEQRVTSLLSRIGFWDDPSLRPAQLSSGERKMASFARALITDPEVLFMDAPLLSVDDRAADRMRNITKGLKTDGKTLVISTTNPTLISFLADRIVVMKEGRILVADEFIKVVDSTDPEVIEILEKVLNRAESYDSNILDLLGTNE
jgi:phospholipid/cholesterol/gamma-HCH transport system ATP-binding protein